MVLLNGEQLDMTLQIDRRKIGHYYEYILYNLLVSMDMIFILQKMNFVVMIYFIMIIKTLLKYF